MCLGLQFGLRRLCWVGAPRCSNDVKMIGWKHPQRNQVGLGQVGQYFLQSFWRAGLCGNETVVESHPQIKAGNKPWETSCDSSKVMNKSPKVLEQLQLAEHDFFALSLRAMVDFWGESALVVSSPGSWKLDKRWASCTARMESFAKETCLGETFFKRRTWPAF